MGKYTQYVTNERIPEWRDYYINYDFLKAIISKLKQFKAKTTTYLMNQYVTNISSNENNFIATIKDEFESNFCREVIKFNKFTKFVMQRVVNVKLFKIHLNLKLNDKKNFTYNVKMKNKSKLKEATEKYYKELHFLIKFVDMNFLTINRLIEQYRKMFKSINMYDKTFETEFNEILVNLYAFQNTHKLKKLKIATEEFYLKNFYMQYQIKEGKEELYRILRNKQYKNKEAVTLGFYVGIFLASLLITICLLIELNFFNGESNSFLKFQIPIFRGSLIIFLYWLFLGFNVATWEKYNINYKRVFNIQLHHSSSFQIFQRVAIFLTFWMLIFLYSALSYIYTGSNLFFFNYKLEVFLPPLIWILFFFYILYPSKVVFNFKGRKYFFNLIKNVIISPFIYIEFVVPWATDQLLSLVIPLKDLTYTICYSIHSLKTYEVENNCYKNPYLQIELIIIFVPLMYRFIQCIKKAFENNRIEIYRQLFNAGKYFCAMIVTFLNMYQELSDSIYYWWLGLFIFSTLYSYYWDLKYDFGFLQSKTKNFLLRDRLYYPHKSFYYIAFVINLGLRFAWTLTISPIQFRTSLYQALIVTTLSLLETFRRTFWNYYKVEYENLKFEQGYTTVEGFILPFQFDLNMEDQKLKELIEKFIENQLSEATKKPKDNFLLTRNLKMNQLHNVLENFKKKKHVIFNEEKYRNFNKIIQIEDIWEMHKNNNLKKRSVEKNLIKQLEKKFANPLQIKENNAQKYNTRKTQKQSIENSQQEIVHTPQNTLELNADVDKQNLIHFSHNQSDMVFDKILPVEKQKRQKIYQFSDDLSEPLIKQQSLKSKQITQDQINILQLQIKLNQALRKQTLNEKEKKTNQGQNIKEEQIKNIDIKFLPDLDDSDEKIKEQEENSQKINKIISRSSLRKHFHQIIKKKLNQKFCNEKRGLYKNTKEKEISFKKKEQYISIRNIPLDKLFNVKILQILIILR